MRIYKYGLDVADRQTIMLPKGAEILTVQTQHNGPYLWALVDPNASPVDRFIEIFGTGHEVREEVGVERRYISTFQLSGGVLVFHAFERLT